MDGLHVPFYFQASGPLQNLIHALKYGGMTSVGRILGRCVARSLEAGGEAAGPALLVPVPLHRVKQRERGYNQAACIARGIADVLRAPVEYGLLRRIRYTESQTHLSVDQRELNVAAAFRGNGAEMQRLEHHTVLLVDDVITTGATIRACACALRDAGAARIVACAVALAERGDLAGAAFRPGPWP